MTGRVYGCALGAQRFDVWAVGGPIVYDFGPASLTVWATQEITHAAVAAHQDIEDRKMKNFNYARAVQAALICIAMTESATLARADIKDYEFQLVDQTVKKGDAIIAVRFIHKPDGKPVSDAVIFATRLDMAPDGMQEMTTKIAPMPSTEPGVYKFKATVSVVGGWQLSLGAKVQGETGTVESKLVLKATP
jgi:YtkA-like protein